VKKTITSLIAILFLGGCIYAMELTPSYEEQASLTAHSLDLSLSLGDISNCFLEKCRTRSPKELKHIDTVFIEAVSGEQIVNTVVSSEENADMYVNIIHYPDAAEGVPTKKQLYRDILTITGLGFITPLPYPFYIDSEVFVTFMVRDQEETVELKTYSFTFNSYIKAASILGARYKRYDIQERLIRYLVPFFADMMRKDYDFFHAIEQALKNNDGDQLRSIAAHETA